jgi:hypothetical protein
LAVMLGSATTATVLISWPLLFLVALVFRRVSIQLLAKKEGVLQGMNNRLIEIGWCYGMEMNVEKLRWCCS